MVRNDPVSGGFVAVPAGIDERHVLLRNGSWELLVGANKNQIREFGGCMMLGSGQLVPLDQQPTSLGADEK